MTPDDPDAPPPDLWDAYLAAHRSTPTRRRRPRIDPGLSLGPIFRLLVGGVVLALALPIALDDSFGILGTWAVVAVWLTVGAAGTLVLTGAVELLSPAPSPILSRLGQVAWLALLVAVAILVVGGVWAFLQLIESLFCPWLWEC